MKPRKLSPSLPSANKMAPKPTPPLRSLPNISYTVLVAMVLSLFSHGAHAKPAQPQTVEHLDLIFFAEIPLNCTGSQITCPTQLQCSPLTIPYVRCPGIRPNTCCAVLPPFCGAMACDRAQGCGRGVELALYTGIRDCSIHGAGFGHYYCQQLEAVDEKGGCCMLGFGSNDWEVDPDGVRGGCSAEWWYHSHQQEKRHGSFDTSIRGGQREADGLSEQRPQPCVEASVLAFYDDAGLQREVHVPNGEMGRAGTMVLQRNWKGLLKEFDEWGESFEHSNLP
ncbi:hypothetical protein B0H65DRAFT_311953 [Neurospora tetraspora]|uniref:Uncharacterized protein n=1 Tax=Neurospora tetraspora TaxID=94610 RepID=A0AAE0MMH8_9PEZI|nr:hypothetical protein B0H65DRAFT_311953 [Neurospora tetraspora]